MNKRKEATEFLGLNKTKHEQSLEADGDTTISRVQLFKCKRDLESYNVNVTRNVSLRRGTAAFIVYCILRCFFFRARS